MSEVVCPHCDKSYGRKSALNHHLGKHPSHPRPYCRVLRGLPLKFKSTPFPLVTNPVKHKSIAECARCKEQKELCSPKRQLCANCALFERYNGAGNCDCCGRESNGSCAFYNLPGTFLICESCRTRKNTYQLSFEYIKDEIYTIKECQICNVTLDWRPKSVGNNSNTPNIDHEHYEDMSAADQKKYGEQGKLRGVICWNCNKIEGSIIKNNPSSLAWAEGLIAYLENPPLAPKEIWYLRIWMKIKTFLSTMNHLGLSTQRFDRRV